MVQDRHRPRPGNSTYQLLTPEEVAEKLKLSANTLRKWRTLGRLGPLPFVKIGGRVRYINEDVDAFIARQRRVTNESESGSDDFQRSGEVQQ